MNKLIKTFRQISKNDVSVAGGKGASLGEMTQAKLPVPSGFVVLASAYEQFIEETKIAPDIEAILKKTNHKDINSVNKASAEIHNLILSEEMPADLQTSITAEFKKLKSPFVAVRSSATAEDSKVASWAGELETYLNTTEKTLIGTVKKCWASLCTPRAIFYRFEKRLHKTKVSVAVVVQTMAQSEIAGICFTVHPVTKDRNQMVIEAGFGLGETIVGGLITPDTYIIHKNTLSILETNISRQKFMLVKTTKGNAQKKLSSRAGGRQKLSAKQIARLAKICKAIEKHYACPQDIEWALYKGKFYILQSRPITTL